MACTALQLYACFVLLVCVGTASFLVWGCLCNDLDNDIHHDWNMITTIESKREFECQIHVSAALGVGWCCALTGVAGTALCVSCPALVIVLMYYGPYRCFLSLFRGSMLSTGTALLLSVGLAGKDPPPGFGISGIPLGGSLVAATAVLCVFFSLSGFGFYRNKTLGISLELGAMYLITSGNVAVATSFDLHVGMGFAVFLDLTVVMAFGLQVYMGDVNVCRALIAFFAPLCLGVSISVILEITGLELPELVGSLVGLSFAFLTTIPLSRAYEVKGFQGAVVMFAFLGLQMVALLASLVAGVHLNWFAAVLMGVAVEASALITLLVWKECGNIFAIFVAIQACILLVGFGTILRQFYLLEWELSVAIASGTALAEMCFVGMGFLRKGVIGGLRAVFIAFLMMLMTIIILNDVLLLGFAPLHALLFGLSNTAVLLTAFTLALLTDDGSGRLYGSGVEWLGGVLVPLVLGFGAGVVLYSVAGASTGAVHVGASAIGAQMLFCPALARLLPGPAQANSNLFRGAKLSIVLQLITLANVLLLYFGAQTELMSAVLLAAAHAATNIATFAAAIWRYGMTILLVFLAALGAAVGALLAVFVYDLRWRIPTVLCSMAIPSLVAALAMARPLAQQRADLREDEAVARRRRALVRQSEREAERLANKSKDPRRKHADKAQQLSLRSQLPSFAELSHNGVPELLAELQWCLADGKRPTLPLSKHVFVARGAYLFLFVPQTERMPSDRALGAMPLHGSRCVMHPWLEVAPMPRLKNMLFVHLRLGWRGRKNFYLHFDTKAQLRFWFDEISRRSTEKSSTSEFRRSVQQQAAEHDPAIAGAEDTRRRLMGIATKPVVVHGSRLDHRIARMTAETLQRDLHRKRRRSSTRKILGPTARRSDEPERPSARGREAAAEMGIRGEDPLASAVFGNVVVYEMSKGGVLDDERRRRRMQLEEEAFEREEAFPEEQQFV